VAAAAVAQQCLRSPVIAISSLPLDAIVVSGARAVDSSGGNW